MTHTIEVRDLRGEDWVWTNKSFLFSALVDEKMYKVYSGLAAYAHNSTQKAWPGVDTLAKRLHMGRNTILRALALLEKNSFISIEKKLGEHNVYSLLKVPPMAYEDDEIPSVGVVPIEPKKQTPANNARSFFTGVQALSDKTIPLPPEAIEVQEFLRALSSKYPGATKEIVWSEIKKFEQYWTELNATGTKRRWEKQEAFMVERRLATWFSKKEQFKNTNTLQTKGKRIV